jgi:hypothetical protein
MTETLGEVQACTWPCGRQHGTEPEWHPFVSDIMDYQGRRQRFAFRGSRRRVELAERGSQEPFEPPGHPCLYALSEPCGVSERLDRRPHIGRRRDQNQALSGQSVKDRDLSGQCTHRVGHHGMSRAVVADRRTQGRDHLRKHGTPGTVRARAGIAVPQRVQRYNAESGLGERADEGVPRPAVRAPAMHQVHDGALTPCLGGDARRREIRDIDQAVAPVSGDRYPVCRHPAREFHAHPHRGPCT